MDDSPTTPDSTEPLEGRVIKSFGSRFIVMTAHGTFDCSLRGRFRLDAGKVINPIAVGDHVEITVEDPPYGVIDNLQPRRNKLSRPDIINPDREQILVANCDQLIVVGAIAQPRFKTGAIDRFLLSAEKNGIAGVVVINKTDLAKPQQVEKLTEVYEAAGYAVVATSTVSGAGIERLREILRFKTSMICGHSGVGKSSLINALQPGLAVETGEVSEATGKGIHTTTTIELHPLEFGGYIVDTPGIRVIGIWELRADELPELYPEFRALLGQCRFRNCVHIGEPDCAIKKAVDAGRINRERYDGYLRIRGSL
ncbi:MAG: ribosome small subunit-dependent GTPase A [Candidatus Zixiibacteriota bacterium]